MNVLVVEDGEDKWAEVSRVLREALPEATQERAWDLFEAEKALIREHWDLLVLDISLDIRKGGGRAGAAHDFVGGLKILGRMYYDELIIPTIIVTGFDSFPSVRTNGEGVMLGLEDLEREASRQLASNHVGTVRHGPEGWEQELHAILRRYADRKN